MVDIVDLAIRIESPSPIHVYPFPTQFYCSHYDFPLRLLSIVTFFGAIKNGCF